MPHAEQRSDHAPRDRATRGQLIAWAFYDWANNSFATLIQTFVFAAYFTRRVAEDRTTGSTQWGVAIGAAGIVVALGGPLIGAMADQGRRRKPWIALFTALCVAATVSMWFVEPQVSDVWLALVLVALGTIGVQYALIFYNAMLPALAPREQLGRWSGWAWALGFVGGLLCLGLALVLLLDWGTALTGGGQGSARQVRLVFPLVAGWYALFSLPLFFITPDAPGAGKPLRRAARDGLAQLRDTLRNLRRYAPVVRFLIARLFYIDALATIFAFGGVYAAGTFDMTEREVVMFGIAANVAAAIGAGAFSWVDDWIGGKATIIISLIALVISVSGILIANTLTWFWIFGIAMGVFVGPVQAASRSFLSRVAPEDLRAQMFGLYALSAKATAFAGPLLVGLITWIGASQRLGMSVVVAFLLIGLGVMFTVPKESAITADDAGEA